MAHRRQSTPLAELVRNLLYDTIESHGHCSPDDLAQDSSAVTDEYGLVEYKCPYTVGDTSVVEACKKKDL